MTLNLIGVSEDGVYQSSDFRLTYSTGQVTDWNVQKIVLASTFDWVAWIQFTGLAEAGSFNTERWIGAKISEIGPAGRLEELIGKLRGVEGIIGSNHRLTFTVTGFQNGQPFVYLISNFESINLHRRREPRQSWEVSSVQIRPGKVFAIATGSYEYVNDDQLRNIRSAVQKFSQEPLSVHRVLADINRRAARSAKANGPISESCFTAHILRDGTGEATPHNVNPGGEYMPAFALKGMPLFIAKKGPDGRPLPRRLVGFTLSRTGNAFGGMYAFRNVEEPTPSSLPISSPC